MPHKLSPLSLTVFKIITENEFLKSTGNDTVNMQSYYNILGCVTVAHAHMEFNEMK